MSRWSSIRLTQHDVVSHVRQFSGVYVAYHGSTVVYIGSSYNLRARLMSHYKYAPGKWSQHPEVRIKFRYTKRFGEYAMAELRLINRIRPTRNQQHCGGMRREAAHG